MGYADRYLKCMDCSSDFIFTVGEQEYFDKHDLKNEPKRCQECREKRKLRRRDMEHQKPQEHQR